MKALINFKYLIIYSICLFTCFYTNTFSQTNFTSKDVKVNLFSSTPLEDIKAESKKGFSVIVPKNKQIMFQLGIKSLVFPRPLMQEHFNENYMESEKYANATFKGTITEDVDFTKDGNYDVTVNGLLNVHGVAKQRTIAGKINIVNGKISVYSSFDVLCDDHNIKIPKIVFTKIAEKINITVNASYN